MEMNGRTIALPYLIRVKGRIAVLINRSDVPIQPWVLNQDE